MSSNSIDYMVYCRKSDRKATFVVVSDRLWRGAVIVFLEKTWFLWWIVASLFILRWFHLFAFRTDGEGTFEEPNSASSSGSSSNQIPSGTARRLFT
jgi:hypothetical protein